MSWCTVYPSTQHPLSNSPRDIMDRNDLSGALCWELLRNFKTPSINFKFSFVTLIFVFFQLFYWRTENDRAFRDVRARADRQAQPNPRPAGGGEEGPSGGQEQPQELPWLQQDGELWPLFMRRSRNVLKSLMSHLQLKDIFPCYKKSRQLFYKDLWVATRNFWGKEQPYT